MEKETKQRLEYVKQMFNDTEPEEAATLWKHDAEKYLANGNWKEAIECYENAEAFGANCGYELSLIYTFHLPDFEKAKNCLFRSKWNSIYFSFYYARLLSAFQRYEEALAYYLEAMCGNMQGQQLDNLFQAGCKFNREVFSRNGEERRDFEWLWDDETTGGSMVLSFDAILKGMLKCYYNAGYAEMIDFKSLKQVVDEIVAQIDNEKKK